MNSPAFDQPARHKLREIIAALRARTTHNGCTEAEALAAAEKMAELLSKNGVEDVTELEFDEHKVEIGRRTVVDTLWDHLAVFCHCKLWYSKDWPTKRWHITYFGRWNDVAVAEYLHSLLERHVKAATREFQKTKEYTRRRSPRTKREATKAFQEALTNGLSNKLWAIQWRRTPKIDGTSHQALVLAPLGAVEAELERRGVKFSERGLKPVKGASKGFDNAKDHGSAAARNIDINAAVSGQRDGVAGYLT